MVCLARIITFQSLFEFTKCRELSDVDGNFIPCFQSRIVKAFLDIFKNLPGPCDVIVYFMLHRGQSELDTPAVAHFAVSKVGMTFSDFFSLSSFLLHHWYSAIFCQKEVKRNGWWHPAFCK